MSGLDAAGAGLLYGDPNNVAINKWQKEHPYATTDETRRAGFNQTDKNYVSGYGYVPDKQAASKALQDKMDSLGAVQHEWSIGSGIHYTTADGVRHEYDPANPPAPAPAHATPTTQPRPATPTYPGANGVGTPGNNRASTVRPPATPTIAVPTYPGATGTRTPHNNRASTVPPVPPTGQTSQPSQTSQTSQTSVVPNANGLIDINPATDTMQGQAEKMLQDGNPWIERAKLRAQQAANARGLLNSTMAATAGEAAAIDAVAPFAQHDADQYMNAKQFNSTLGWNRESHYSSLNENARQFDERQQETARQFDDNLQWSKEKFNLDFGRQTDSMDLDSKNKFASYFNNARNNLEKYKHEIEINADLSPEAKNDLIQRATDTFIDDSKLYAALFSVPLGVDVGSDYEALTSNEIEQLKAELKKSGWSDAEIAEAVSRYGG